MDIGDGFTSIDHPSLEEQSCHGHGGSEALERTLNGDRGLASLHPVNPRGDTSEGHDCEMPQQSKSYFEEYKKRATIIVEEYFATDDVADTADELRDLEMPGYDYYFVKKLVSTAMDRHDKEKEMAADLLSALYADVIDPGQVYKGFAKLVESADDLIVDIPDTVDVLAVFIAKAIVDDILPPAFVKKQMKSLPQGSKGIDVLQRADTGYLAVPLHAEIVERRWGGSKMKTVEGVKIKIADLLKEYIVSSDMKEAYRCIQELKVPFFHHEIVKQVLVMIMERPQTEKLLLDLLKGAAEECLINLSQITKGFGRIIETVDDLSLDIPNARDMLQTLICKAASEGWLSASSLKSLSSPLARKSIENGATKIFKMKSRSMIQEYFLSGDIWEVSTFLESENSGCSDELNAVFVKGLITLAMDRKKREKEMASMLLSSLCLPGEDVMHGFILLIDSADDTALDNPVVVEDLAMFLARAVVDEVLNPQHIEEIESHFQDPDSIGSKVLQMAKSLLKARLSGERIMRCWGGGGSCNPGWAIEDIKEKIGQLLEEYECSGELREACHCIKELGMPFFHHEIVKKAIIKVIEKRSDKLWDLLEQCYTSGLITSYQMSKGFGRVVESLDDLALDVPDARNQFSLYTDRARDAGWLDSSFCIIKEEHGHRQNGI